MTVYIDSVFALNALTDWLLILVTARLAGLSPWRREYVLAALAGGAYAAAAFLPGWGFLAAAPVKCAAGVGMALAAFGREEHLGRLTVLFFAVSCAFAGCVLALRLLTGRGEAWILPAGAVCALALGTGFRSAARHHAGGTLLPVRVNLLGRTACLTALWDSGNALRESGRPVLVVSPGGLEILAPDCPLLAPDRLRTPADLLEPLMARYPQLRPRLLPYHAVGVAGLLLTVESGWTEAGGIRYPRLRLALSPTELGTGYNALWGGEPGKGGLYEDSDSVAAFSGAAGGAGRSGDGTVLRRGKRYPAAHPEPGTGGGTAGTSGR